MKSLHLFVAFIIILTGILLWREGYLVSQKNKEDQLKHTVITTFEACVARGNPIMESYPRACATGGNTFVENIGNTLEKIDLIRLTTPQPNEHITSPFMLVGEARGPWYFEGDFPIVITDWSGKIIGRGYATAQDNWMTIDFVPFTATIIFETPTNKNNGMLILQKDNPSALPEYDDSLTIPVFFKDTSGL